MVTSDATILSDTKQLLGISQDDNSFDIELTMHTNSAISILTQLGVGPIEGFIITADTPWTELIGDRKDLEIIRSYIYLRVRLIFDPPQNSFLVKSINDQCTEYEWRIKVQTSTPPTTEVIDATYDEFGDEFVYDE